jgi:ABC-2 type transport system ATP-binding protein
LLLDEPFAALDGVGARVLEEEILCLRRSGGLVLLTGHDLDLAERLADRIGVLERGRMVFEGSVPSFRAVRRELLGEGSETPKRTDR